MRRDREVQDLKFAPPNFLIRSVIRKIESAGSEFQRAGRLLCLLRVVPGVVSSPGWSRDKWSARDRCFERA